MKAKVPNLSHEGNGQVHPFPPGSVFYFYGARFSLRLGLGWNWDSAGGKAAQDYGSRDGEIFPNLPHEDSDQVRPVSKGLFSIFTALVFRHGWDWDWNWDWDGNEIGIGTGMGLGLERKRDWDSSARIAAA